MSGLPWAFPECRNHRALVCQFVDSAIQLSVDLRLHWVTDRQSSALLFVLWLFKLPNCIACPKPSSNDVIRMIDDSKSHPELSSAHAPPLPPPPDFSEPVAVGMPSTTWSSCILAVCIFISLLAPESACKSSHCCLPSSSAATPQAESKPAKYLQGAGLDHPSAQKGVLSIYHILMVSETQAPAQPKVQFVGAWPAHLCLRATVACLNPAGGVAVLLEGSQGDWSAGGLASCIFLTGAWENGHDIWSTMNA